MVGEYTTRTRFENPNGQEIPGYDPRVPYYRNADLIYSYRTKLSPADIKARSESKNNFGIKPPKSKGSIFDIVADRKRFINELEDIAGSAPRPTSGQKVCLTTDAGHPFTSVKYRALRVARVLRYWDGGQVNESSLAYGSACVPKDVSDAITVSNFQYARQPLPEIGQPSSLAQRERLNSAFNSLNPLTSDLKVGETVAALLSGQLPRLFKGIEDTIIKFRKRQWRESAKAAGGEHLNQVFGWQPLIDEILGVIKLLSVVDNLVYGSSTRRSRKIDLGTFHSTRDVTGTALQTGYGQKGLVTSNGHRYLLPVVNLTIKQDIRLSTRLVPIARPGIGANLFIDQVEEVIHDLGLWYPSLGWDLLPYSWLIDWATNLGSAINNAYYFGNRPGQVSIDYAWATTYTSVLADLEFKKKFAVVGATYFKSFGNASELTISKQRQQATPYGFGIRLPDLSPDKIGILVALGLVKGL